MGINLPTVYPNAHGFMEAGRLEINTVPDEDGSWPGSRMELTGDLVKVADFDSDQLRNPWEDRNTYSGYLDDVEPIPAPVITVN